MQCAIYSPPRDVNKLAPNDEFQVYTSTQIETMNAAIFKY